MRNAVFSMNGLKVSGVNGIQPIFYQKNWDVIHDLIFRFVEEALKVGEVDLEVLKAYILKGSIPIFVKDFRPFTLLNTSYKILSKVIVNRLRPILQ